MSIDIARLTKAAQFLKENESFSIDFDEVSVTLTQGKNWLYISIQDQFSGYKHGMNLNRPMQENGNFEYWVFKTLIHVKEKRENDQKESR